MDLSSLTKEEAFDIVLGLMKARKITNDQFELLTQHFGEEIESDEQTKGHKLK